LRIALATLLLATLSACSSNSCLDLCQEYELYLEECGYGWSTAFAEEGWTTLDDCYNAHWEADSQEQSSCDQIIQDHAGQACF
jgi:hypothetical protein